MKKGKQPLLYVLSSVASWVVDTGGFFMLSLLLGAALGAYSEPVCNVTARVISSFFNFNLNNRLVFQNTGSYGKALFRVNEREIQVLPDHTSIFEKGV